MQIPEININGTSRSYLFDQYLKAAEALRKAAAAVRETAPNGRDFVPQGSSEATDKLRAAQREHDARLKRIDSVLDEIMKIAEAIQP